jgi:glucosyl-3-phosphoglycerate synthase
LFNLANLSRAEYLDKIIFGLDQASKSEMQLLQKLIQKYHIHQAIIQWNDGPIYSKIYQMLNDAGMVSLEPGKGKNIFLGIGIALALNALDTGLTEAILSVESEVKEKVFETPHTASWERVFYKIPNIHDILREAVGTK